MFREDRVIEDACNGGSYQRSDPEQPQLLQG